MHDSIIRLLPEGLELPARYYYNRLLGKAEQELGLIHQFAGRSRRAIDVGANVGLYSYEFSRYFKAVESFEPNPSASRGLRGCGLPNLTLHDMALSNSTGEATLVVPLFGGQAESALGSLEPAAGDASVALLPDGACGTQEVRVQLRTLDSFDFDDVDLIKIDVEGHEMEVVEGALATLARCRPTLMVEIEQRHHPKRTLAEIFARFRELDYEGQFFLDGRFRPLAEFAWPEMQSGDPLSRQYVNNFFFSSAQPR